MGFEIEIIKFLQSGRCPFLDVSFQVVSAVGSVLGVAFLILLLVRFAPRLCFWYLFSYGFVLLVVRVMKGLVQRVRPFNASDVILNIGDAVQDFSFPSGHAACATAIAIFLGLLLFKFLKSKRARVGVVICLGVYVALVCLSRMYLGKHYLTDVLAGVAISATLCVVGILFMKFCQKLKEKRKNES